MVSSDALLNGLARVFFFESFRPLSSSAPTLFSASFRAASSPITVSRLDFPYLSLLSILDILPSMSAIFSAPSTLAFSFSISFSSRGISS